MEIDADISSCLIFHGDFRGLPLIKEEERWRYADFLPEVQFLIDDGDFPEAERMEGPIGDYPRIYLRSSPHEYDVLDGQLRLITL